MRPTTHPNRFGPQIVALRRRPAVVSALAVAVVSATVIACSERAMTTDEIAVESRPVAASSVGTPGRDEAARGIIGDGSASRQFGKVAGEAAQTANADMASAPAPSPAAPPTLQAPLTPASQTSTSASMIIRTGHAGIEVDSLDTAIARVRTLAQRVGGFIANTAVQGGKDQLRSASLEVKIPSDRFDEALAGLAPIGKVESVNVHAQDVGEEYVDIAARVENAQRLEARLIGLLANRTGKLQEVLSVERELARVREEIERYEGRMRFLRARVALSTLTIAVHERAPIIVPVAGNGPITIAFREAWRNFVGLVAGFIASLGVLIPLGVLAFVGWLGVRRWAPWRPTGGTPPATGTIAGD